MPQTLSSPHEGCRFVADNRTPLDEAVRIWRQDLGDDQVCCQAHVTQAYAASTSAVERKIPVVLRPSKRDQVVAIVRTAAKYGVPLYPISRGRNWGYGCANPAVNGCAVVDLSGLDRILELDSELGVVTLEPGVTQQQLDDYLTKQSLPFCVPVHGGGPDCSLLGNALERGYGITPHADHFGALTNLEAVLPDGQIYRSPLSELGGELVDRAFKWGIGPYVDGLFAQGNLGIVTKATIALARRTEQTTAFLFMARSDADLEAFVLAVRDLQRRLGSVCTPINLMNDLRVLSMTVPYPQDEVSSDAPIPKDIVDRLARDNQVAPWTGIGAIQGDAGMVRSALRSLKRRLRPHVKRLVTFDDHRLRLFQSVAQCLPNRWRTAVGQQLSAAESFLQIVKGTPSRVALPLAYWKSGRKVDLDSALDPAADGCGLSWFAPLVPMKPDLVRNYTTLVTHTCRDFGLDPLITLTSLSDRCFDSTVPLLFDQNDPTQVLAAKACHDQLLNAGRKQGFVPYRLGIDHMPWAINPDTPYWSTVGKLKSALDPQNLIAPGRYCPVRDGIT